MFGFSKGEANALVLLLPFIALTLLSGTLFRWWVTSGAPDTSTDKRKLDSLVATLEWSKEEVNSNEPRLQTFNPNTATKEELEELGIASTVAQRIINYRQKGGKYRVKSDLKKMYGFDSLLYTQLAPFINLPDKQSSEGKFKKETPPLSTTRAIAIEEKFDINLADTAQLKKIYGIGTVRAERIVKFRTRLGGFINLQQLQEVYGLDSAVLQQLAAKSFVAPDFKPSLVKLNTATAQELATHPYLNYKLANAITTYRFQHGPFQSIDELQKIATLPPNVFDKIKPYLSLE